jgi:hypothetical protein
MNLEKLLRDFLLFLSSLSFVQKARNWLRKVSLLHGKAKNFLATQQMLRLHGSHVSGRMILTPPIVGFGSQRRSAVPVQAS